MATRIHIDFNDIESDGGMTALVADANGLVVPGTLVILYDADKNVCEARVVSVVGNLVRLSVEWATWNRVNTLLDALRETVKDVQAHAASFDLIFGRSVAGTETSPSVDLHLAA